MKNIYLIIAMLLFVDLLNAQDVDKPDWRNPNRKFTLKEIQADFNEYWQGKRITPETPRGERAGWKQFKRWEYFWEQRVDEEGNFPPRGHVFEEYLKYKEREKKNKSEQTQSTTWSHLGPTTSSGGYSGLGRLNCVVEDPDYNGSTNKTIWVGAASGGIWKSTDAGSSWSTNTDELAVLGIGDICIDPDDANIMYAATGDGDATDTYSIGVLKSTDAGSTWNTTGFQKQVNQAIVCRRMIISHSDGNDLFLATNGGFFISTDAGANWTQKISGGFYDVKMHPTNANYVYASTNTAFWRSTNGGANWTQITSGVPTAGRRFALAVSADEPAYVYILASDNSSGFLGLYRSTDSGANFTTRSTTPNILNSSSDGSGTGGQGWYDLALAVDPSNAENVMVGGVNVWKSTNGGTSWSIKTYWYNNGVQDEVHADHHMLHWPASGRVYTANDGGLDVSTDGGTNWNYKGSGLRITQFYRISVSQTDENEVLCGAQDNSSFLKKTGSFGMTKSTGDGMDQAINPNNGDLMFTASYYGNMSRSTNGGNNWASFARPEGGAWVTPYVIDPNNNNMIAGYVSVWKSTNNGTTWTDISDFSNASTLGNIHVSRSNSNYIYAGRATALWRTTNGGTNWSTISLPSSNLTTVTSNHSDPNEIWISCSNYNTGSKVYHSTNGGTNWTNISGSLPNVPCNVVMYEPNANDRVWVGTDIGVWYRDADDSDWTSYNNGLPNVICNDLEIYETGSKLRVGTYGRGLWEVDLPTTDFSGPGLVFPENAATEIELNDSLKWNPIDNAVRYHLQISKFNDFSVLLHDMSNHTDTTFNIQYINPDSNTVYFWKVRAISASDTTFWSSVNSFTTVAFPAPILVSPADAATGLDKFVNFSWNLVTGATSYDFELAKDATFSNIVSVISNNTLVFSNPNLTYEKEYFWRVRSRQGSNIGTWSPVRSFKVMPDPGYCFKFEENFEGMQIPIDWQTAYESGNLDWNFQIQGSSNGNPSAAQQGVYNAEFYENASGSITKIITPLIQIDDCGDTLYLEFYEARVNSGGNSDILKVYYQLEGESTWNLLQTYSSEASSWTRRLINISSISGNFKIAFEGTSNNGNGISLDNIAIYGAFIPYCAASTTGDDEFIERVQFGDIDKTSGWQNGVANYRYLSTNLLVGQAYTITVTNGEPYVGDVVRAWIDFDQSGTYDNDEVFALSTADYITFTGTINIAPGSDYVQGRTGMRVRMDYGTPTQCGVGSWGEAEDYSVRIFTDLSAPVLYAPQDAAVDQNIALTLDWLDVVDAERYEIQLSETNDFATTEIDEELTATEKAVSGLLYNTQYYWRVRAKSDGDVSEWSNIWSFMTFPELLPPDLTTPADQAYDQAISLTLDWEAADLATSYDIQLSEETDFSNNIIDENLVATEKAVTNLEYETSFYWRVRAKNADQTSAWSDTWTFLTVEPPLDEPLLVSPVDNAITQPLALTLDWNAVTNATSYDIQLSTVGDFAITIIDANTENTEKAVTGLDYNETYYWRARAKNDNQTGEWSSIYSFTTLVELLAPNLNSPANSATNQETSIEMDWDEVTNAEAYDVQLSTSANFSSNILVNDEIIPTSKTYAGMAFNTVHYWRVRAITNEQDGPWSAVWSFTTKEEFLPPTLSSPADDATNQNISLTLSWNAAEDATSYQVQLSTTNDFASTVIDAEQSELNKAISNLDYETTYFWRVKSKKSGEDSEWSDVWNFSTKIQLATPNLSSPNDNATDQNLNLMFMWGNVSGASSYNLQIAKTSDFSTLFADENVTSFFKSIGGFSSATTYYWRVKALNGDDYSDWSSVRTFTTISTITVPTLLSPSNNAQNHDTEVEMDWEDASGADNYDIQLSTTSDFSSNLLVNDEIIPSQKTYAGMAYNTTHYWRVRAKNDSETSAWSQVWSFTTKPELITPTLASPANETTNTDLAFNLQWNATANATGYILQVSESNTFATLYASAVQAGLTKAISGLDTSKTYYWRVRAYNAAVDTTDWSSVWQFTTRPNLYLLVPDEWEFTITSTTHSVLVPVNIDPQIDGRDIQDGDVVGAFYLDGTTRKCAGYEVWDGGNLAMNVYGDDDLTPEKDGFEIGEALFFKLWDGTEGKEYESEYTVASGPSLFTSNGITTLASLYSISSIVTHDIALNSGWNMISSHLIPEKVNMDSVFKDIKSNILIVKNGLGKLYVPSYNINTIGNWNETHGYQVYSTQVQDLSITGTEVEPENTPIYPTIGWNMLSYLRNSEMSSITAMASVTDRNNLLIMKNGLGKLYVPSYSINTIGNMKMGDGYQMYISGLDTLIYPANGASKVIFSGEILENVSLIPEFEATGSDMTLIIEANYEDATEIGVYNTDGMLIGSGIFQNGTAGLTIWGDDEYTDSKDGAAYLEVLSVKVLENGNLIEKEVEYSDGNELTFEKGGFVVGKINVATMSNAIKVTPNPATDKLTIELPNEEMQSVEIRDMKGKLMLELSNDKVSNEINISNFTNGTYFITITTENGTYTEKFVKVK